MKETKIKNPEGKLLMDFISKHGLIRCSAIEKLVRAPQGSIRKSRPIPKRYCKAVRLILEKKYGLEKDVTLR